MSDMASAANRPGMMERNTGVGTGRADDQDTNYLPSMFKRTAWGAIVAGALAAIAVQMLMTLLGIAVGVSAVDVSEAASAANTGDADGFSIAAAAWWLITGTISVLIGGAVVGRLIGTVRSPDVLLHAFIMWALTAVFGFTLLWSTAGALYSGTPMGYLMGDTGSSYRDTSTTSGGSTTAATPTSEELTALETARQYTRNASWWGVGMLLVGIGAALGGAWWAAPDRIVLTRPVARTA